jgi:putative N6-adenine-specific DNA methylase
VWSGTFLAAAMIACNIPANINRKEFALKNGTTGTMSCLIYITTSLLKRVREFHYTITGYDKAPSAVQKAKTIVKT